MQVAAVGSPGPNRASALRDSRRSPRGASAPAFASASKAAWLCSERARDSGELGAFGGRRVGCGALEHHAPGRGRLGIGRRRADLVERGRDIALVTEPERIVLARGLRLAPCGDRFGQKLRPLLHAVEFLQRQREIVLGVGPAVVLGRLRGGHQRCPIGIDTPACIVAASFFSTASP